MKTANQLALMAGGALDSLPRDVKKFIDEGTASALLQVYNAAGTVRQSNYLPELGSWSHKLAATLSGAVGGFGGLSTAAFEIPVTIGTIFALTQKIAQSYGFDPTDEKIRQECIRVFDSGGPLKDDDAVEFSFLGSKVAVTGTAVHSLIARVAPNLALVLTQKLGAQAVPVLGSITGAALNHTFISYYEEMAHVRFGLLKLATDFGPDRVRDVFRGEVARLERR
jgi:hypothetical protein